MFYVRAILLIFGSLLIPLRGETFFRRVPNDQYYRYIDSHGKSFTDANYDYASEFNSKSVAFVTCGGKCFFLNDKGFAIQISVPSQIAHTMTSGWDSWLSRKRGKFSDEGLWVKVPRDFLLKQEYSLTNSSYVWLFIGLDGVGKFLCKAEDVRCFSEGLAAVKEDGKWGFITVQGNMQIACKYDDVCEFHDGAAAVRMGELWGFIDTDGIWLCPPKFTHVNREYGLNGCAVQQPSGEIVFVHYDGTELFQQKFLDASSFREGLAVVKIPDGTFDHRGRPSGKYGYTDVNGNMAIQPIFDNADSFSEGLAAVCIGGAWGFIDLHGSFVIPPRYAAVDRFIHGLAEVWPKGDMAWSYFIDKTGRIVYDSSEYTNEEKDVIDDSWATDRSKNN